MGWPITHPSTIYAIRCKENGKVYIGRTYRFEQRIREHFLELRKAQKNKTQRRGVRISTDFQNDYDRFGESAFEVYVLEKDVPPEFCQTKEAFWITKYDATNPKCGYNVRSERLRDLDATFCMGIPPKTSDV